MKNKLITIGTAIVLIFTAILVTPVMGANTMEIINEKPKSTLTNQDLEQKYFDMINKISNSQLPVEELKTLYSECSFVDEYGVTVKVYNQIVDIFGTGLAENIDVIFGGTYQTMETRKSAMYDICDILDDIKQDNKDIVTNCLSAFDFIKDNQEMTFDDFPEESREWAEEHYELLLQDIEQKPHLQNLITKITHSKYFALQEVGIEILFIWILYLIVLAGISVMPMGDALIGVVEGAIIGAGFAILMSEASIAKALADVFESLFGYLIPGLDWEAAATFVLGLVAFLIYFTLFMTFRVVRLMGGLAAAVGGCIAIYMFFTMFAPLEEWKARPKSNDVPAAMALMRLIIFRLFQKIAPRLQLFEMF